MRIGRRRLGRGLEKVSNVCLTRESERACATAHSHYYYGQCTDIKKLIIPPHHKAMLLGLAGHAKENPPAWDVMATIRGGELEQSGSLGHYGFSIM